MAASANSESSPLLADSQRTSKSPMRIPTPTKRSVTFNPTIDTNSPPKRRPAFPTNSGAQSSTSISTLQNPSRDGGQPMLSALNSKLRRRNSQGAPLILPAAFPASKIGPQRTTRTAQKLKLLPNPEQDDDADEESGREVYSQFTRIKDPTARRDAARLGKDDRVKLPRVTAYCTAGSYRLDDLMRFLKGRGKSRQAVPKLFDECIYTPYQYNKPAKKEDEPIAEVRSSQQRRFSDSAIEVEEHSERRRGDLIDLQNETAAFDDSNAVGESATAEDADPALTPTMERPDTPDFDTSVHIPEVFLFDYGVVVIWGMSLKEEQRFLKEMAKFEVEKLSKDDIQVENFNFYYTKEYQARIYNDFISLREKKNYMTKLAISHALAQSTKVEKYCCLLRS